MEQATKLDTPRESSTAPSAGNTPAEDVPAAGGSYERDPVTGSLTQVHRTKEPNEE